MRFSLIIPTYNREKLLEKSLQNLYKLKYPRDKFEIIIVDNNSTDNTKKVVKEFQGANPDLSVKYVFERRQGRSFAFDTGAKTAQYSYLVSLDDDVLVRPDFLKIYASSFKKNPQAVIVGGGITAVFQGNKLGARNFLEAVGHDNLWVMGEVNHGDKTKNLKYPEIVFAGNFSIDLRLFKDEVFDKRLGRKYKNVYLYGEDYELCLRMHLEKKQIVYEPKLSTKNVIEASRLTYKYVFRRYVMAGIERYVIDLKFADRYLEHAQYRFYFSLVGMFRDITRGRAFVKKYWLEKTTGFLFAIGYYVLGPIYTSQNTLTFIFNFL